MLFRPFLFALFNLALIAAHSAMALDYKHCESLLANMRMAYTIAPGVTAEVGKNQLLLKGELEPYFETGMEDQTMWSIIDESRKKKVFASPFHSLFSLKKGDEIFILNPDHTVSYRGFFDEKNVSGKFKYEGEVRDVSPNFPTLYSDKELTQVLLEPKAFMRLFQQNVPVAVVHTLSGPEEESFNKVLLPQLKSYEEFQNSPKRFITLGKKGTFEIGHYEYSISGPVTPRIESRSFGVNKTDFLVLDIHTEGKIENPQYWDQIFIFNAAGDLLTYGRVDSGYGLTVPTDPKKRDRFLAKLPQFRTAVLVRSKHREIKTDLY